MFILEILWFFFSQLYLTMEGENSQQNWINQWERKNNIKRSKKIKRGKSYFQLLGKKYGFLLPLSPSPTSFHDHNISHSSVPTKHWHLPSPPNQSFTKLQGSQDIRCNMPDCCVLIQEERADLSHTSLISLQWLAIELNRELNPLVYSLLGIHQTSDFLWEILLITESGLYRGYCQPFQSDLLVKPDKNN